MREGKSNFERHNKRKRGNEGGKGRQIIMEGGEVTEVTIVTRAQEILDMDAVEFEEKFKCEFGDDAWLVKDRIDTAVRYILNLPEQEAFNITIGGKIFIQNKDGEEAVEE